MFTDERRTVKAETPVLLLVFRFFNAGVSTFLAVSVGGGGAAGGGAGFAILGGFDEHIINFYLGCFRFVVYVGF